MTMNDLEAKMDFAGDFQDDVGPRVQLHDISDISKAPGAKYAELNGVFTVDDLELLLESMRGDDK